MSFKEKVIVTYGESKIGKVLGYPVKEKVDSKLIFMYGYPAAGKTTYSKQIHEQNKNSILISADSIRRELYGSEDTFGDGQKIYNIILHRMREGLLSGKDVIYDAVNLRKGYRMDYLNNLADIDCYKEIIRVNTDKKTCIERHLNRNRNIPLENLLPYFEIQEPPTMDEGWTQIKDVSFSPFYQKIYVASPFFQEEHRKRAFEVAELLRKKGHEVYLPLEHKIIDAWDYPNYKWGRMVFDNDIEAIKNSDCVVILSYGRNSTAGTNWEAGYAYGTNKKVIVIEMPEVNLMSLMVANGRTATLKAIEELNSYDFKNYPLLEDREMEQK